MWCLIILVSKIMVQPQGKCRTGGVDFRVAVKMAQALLLDGLIKALNLAMALRVCSSAVDT